MGKTNLLQTMIRGIAGRYTSDDVQMYLLDCASKILKNFEGLKHIGDVITYEEEDKLKNFFKMIEEELAKRKDMLAQLGLSSYSAYCESGPKEVPQIIIMLDNVGMFRELFSGLDDKLLPSSFCNIFGPPCWPPTCIWARASGSAPYSS